METAWPMLFFLAGLVGFVMLILVCGIASREQERGEVTTTAPELLPERSFFAALSEAFEPEPAVDAELVAGVEARVQRQTEVAEQFVDRPSLDNLYDGHDEAAVHPSYSLFQRIQAFLAHERQLATDFVADPSLAFFHARSERLAV